MAMGMEMMLKSLGFDPEAIKKQVLEFQANLARTFEHFDAHLKTLSVRSDAIEARLAALEAQQSVMLQTLILIQDFIARSTSDTLPAGPGGAGADENLSPAKTGKGRRHGGAN